MAQWLHSLSTTPSAQEIESYIQAQSTVDTSRKISSRIKHPLLLLAPNGKILQRLRDLAPNAVIVGFKLAHSKTSDELLDIAYRLLQDNRCDFVVANHVDEVTESAHKAYLLHSSKSTVSGLPKKR